MRSRAASSYVLPFGHAPDAAKALAMHEQKDDQMLDGTTATHFDASGWSW